MTRRRRGRRPGAARDPRDSHDPLDDRQPRVGPDGRPDDFRSGYSPPPSPLTRWQHHGAAARGRAGRGDATGAGWRARWAGDARHGPGARPNAPPGRAERFSAGARSVAAAGQPARPAPPARSTPPPRPAPPPTRRPAPAARPAPRPNAPRAAGAIDPFDLFCAYHLGITPDDGYRIQNIHEVARRFGTNAAELRQVLADLGMAADDIVHSGFDLPGAQVDIMVAPAGISRRELARPLYEEFRAAPKRTRDWAREMEDAQRAIDETIGRDGRWSPAPRDPTGRQS